MNKAIYSVVMSNIGIVYSGLSASEAYSEFDACVECSNSAHGRMSGESVTLFCGDSIIKEHFGANDND